MKDGLSRIPCENHLGLAECGCDRRLGGGGKFGKKFDHCLGAQIGSGIRGRVKNEWEANGFGAEWACQFEGDA